MSKNTVQGAEKRNFTKMFLNVCNWNNPWERWNDMLWLFAIDIANTVDWNHKDKRTETYTAIARKYKPDEFAKFVDLFNEMVLEMDRKPFQDFLGSIYMELDMGSDTHGQFFTPYNLCELNASLAIKEDDIRRQIDEYGWISLNDCACGAGAMLIAGAKRLLDLGIDYQSRALFVGQDLDSTVAMMCYIQLSLLGCAGYVRIGDTLTDPPTADLLLGDGKETTWHTPMLYSEIWSGRALFRWMDRHRFPLPPKDRTRASKPETDRTEHRIKPKKTTPGKEEAMDGRTIQLSLFQ